MATTKRWLAAGTVIEAQVPAADGQLRPPELRGAAIGSWRATHYAERMRLLLSCQHRWTCRHRWTVVLLAATWALGTAWAHAQELQEPKLLLAWGKLGDQPGEFHSPIGVAIDQHDQVVVTDLNNSRVQRFDSAGKFLSEFALPQDSPDRKSCIVGGIAIDDAGQIYLSFMNQHKLAVYSRDGKVVREWGKRGAGDGEFHQPGGIVLRGDGTLLVADQCNHRVQHFTREGKFLSRWGEHGVMPGQFGGLEVAGSRFGGPHFLAQDSQGRLYTTEGVMGRIQQLSGAGRPLLAWGNKSDDPGGFGAYQFGGLKNTFGPIGVAVDRHDRVWVSSLNDRVQAFTPEGKYLFGISTSGEEPGQLSKPHGMAFDSCGNLYVADASNQRIQKFAVPQP
jgi:sugar lactone lactonase YvrE